MSDKSQMPQPDAHTVYAIVVDAGVSKVLEWSSIWQAQAEMYRALGDEARAEEAAVTAQWFLTIGKIATTTIQRLAAAGMIHRAKPAEGPGSETWQDPYIVGPDGMAYGPFPREGV